MTYARCSRVPTGARWRPLVALVALMLAPRAHAQSPSSPDETPFARWLRGPLHREKARLATPAARFEKWRDTAIASPRFGTTIAVVSVPLARARIIVEPVVKHGAVETIHGGLAKAGDVAVVSGGFFGRNGAPDGLVLADDSVHNELAAWTEGGVLTQRNGRIAIVPISAFRLGGDEHALQSKPILVRNRTIDGITPAQMTMADRIGVAIRGDELLIVGAWRDDGRAITQFEFAQLLALRRAEGGLGVDSALGLDGGPSAHLFLPSQRRHFGATPENYVPNVIRVRLNGGH
jgi:hypothetical protein